jgi:hypothetical protein
MIALNSPAGIVVFLTGLLSMIGVAIMAVVITLNRKKRASVNDLPTE